LKGRKICDNCQVVLVERAERKHATPGYGVVYEENDEDYGDDETNERGSYYNNPGSSSRRIGKLSR
jgi:hypothetical protein